MQTPVLLILLVVVLSGCSSSISVTRLTDDSYPATSPEDVQIFLSEDDLSGPYDKIAIIYVETGKSGAIDVKQLETVRQEAAAMGANAIIVFEPSKDDLNSYNERALFGNLADTKAQIIAISLRK